jgi:hypothetical protein
MRPDLDLRGDVGAAAGWIFISIVLALGFVAGCTFRAVLG